MLTARWTRQEGLLPAMAYKEIPTISSELRWDQVRLPLSVTEADLDGTFSRA